MNPSNEADTAYSLEITARITGISEETILRYQEQGLVHPAVGDDRFDDDSLRTLRLIEHLRATCGVNEAGLRLILHLLREIERLRN